jgi:predicted nucleic acid-binding protein
VNYLLDTNHWSYLQRREAGVVRHIQSLPGAVTLYTPMVAQPELLAGIELAVSEPRQQELRELYAQVITTAADILPITSEVTEQFAHIFANLRRKGRPIDTNDIWIAAIARVHNLIRLRCNLGLMALQKILHIGSIALQPFVLGNDRATGT